MSSSTPPASLLRICHLDGPFLPLQPYFCYATEVCCKEGCCSDRDYKYFQSWYFWLALLVLFVLYRYVCWHCRRTRPDADDRRPDDLDSHIVDLMVAYHGADAAAPGPDKEDGVEPPPVYTVALHLPRPEPSRAEPSSCQPVPTYEQATRSQATDNS